MNNCVYTTRNLLKRLKIPFTNQYLEDNILSYPNYNSILSIINTLHKYQINTLAVRTNIEKLLKVQLPCIIQLKDNGEKFFVLTELSSEKSVYINDQGVNINKPISEFIKQWTAVCLIIETTEYSAEPDIQEKQSQKQFNKTLKIISLVGIIFWAVINMLRLPETEVNPFFTISYIALKLIGLAISSILLWYEVDKYNPTLQSFCAKGKK